MNEWKQEWKVAVKGMEINWMWQNRRNIDMAIIKHKMTLIQNTLYPGWANDRAHLSIIIKIRIVSFCATQIKRKCRRNDNVLSSWQKQSSDHPETVSLLFRAYWWRKRAFSAVVFFFFYFFCFIFPCLCSACLCCKRQWFPTHSWGKKKTTE